MDKILENMDECCGCGACMQICPSGAIEMKARDTFYYPVINTTTCIDCGLCQKSCPILNLDYSNYDTPKCYAVCADDDMRLKSSSGGVFGTFAKYFLDSDGVVCGAQFDDNFNVEHVLISNQEDLHKLQKSKYVQSTTKNVFNKIKQALLNNKKVLFVGTPCQCTGLKQFLKKDYDGLIIVDIVCHAVPSPILWRKYLDEKFPNSNIKSVDFRDKTRGWHKNHLTIVDKKNAEYTSILGENEFIYSFFAHMNMRYSCGDCKFNKIPRQGDITIGDFWGIDETKKEYSDEKGTSVVLINNKKGEKIFNTVYKDFSVIEEKSLTLACDKNPNIIKSNGLHSNRELFLQNTNYNSVEKAFSMTQNDIKDVLIVNYWRYHNVGAMLTGFALQKTLDKLGFSNELVSYCHEPIILAAYEKSAFKDFEKKYLRTTPLLNREQLPQLNAKANNFIVGSDQVWRGLINKGDTTFYLDFVEQEKRKISLAASFGVDSLDENKEQKAFARHFIKQFSAISVREDIGVDICQKEFNVKARHILDPVFAVDMSEYEKLLKNSTTNETEDYIATYSILPLGDYKHQIEKIAINYDAKVINISGGDKQLENWLAHIKNAKLLITDSFHGLCFALIFNTPFLYLDVKNGTARIDSLFRTFNISNRSINLDSSIDDTFLYRDFDWKAINEVIEKKSIEIKDYLLSSLTMENKKELDDNTLILNKLIQDNVLGKTERQANKKTSFKLKLKKIRYKIQYKLTFNKNKRKQYKTKYSDIKKQIRELQND